MTRTALGVALTVLAACGTSESPARDAGGDGASDAASAGVVCSAALAPPCDASPLPSAPGCPSKEPTGGDSCTLSAGLSCFYCTGAPSTWASVHQRPVFDCVDGAWRATTVYCASSSP